MAYKMRNCIILTRWDFEDIIDDLSEGYFEVQFAENGSPEYVLSSSYEINTSPMGFDIYKVNRYIANYFDVRSVTDIHLAPNDSVYITLG